MNLQQFLNLMTMFLRELVEVSLCSNHAQWYCAVEKLHLTEGLAAMCDPTWKTDIEDVWEATSLAHCDTDRYFGKLASLAFAASNLSLRDLLDDSFLQRKLRYLFNLYDHDGSGAIERPDVERLIANFREAIGEDPGGRRVEHFRLSAMVWWEAWLDIGDSRKTHRVSYDSYEILWRGMAKETPLIFAQAGKTIFDLLDTDQDGLMTLEEYRNYLRMYDADVALAERTFSSMDEDGDGLVNRFDFATRVAEFFLSEDPQAVGSSILGPVRV